MFHKQNLVLTLQINYTEFVNPEIIKSCCKIWVINENDSRVHDTFVRKQLQTRI